MLRSVALVRSDVSEERIVSIIRVTRIGELGTTLAVTGNRKTLRRNAFSTKNFVAQNRFVAVTSRVSGVTAKIVETCNIIEPELTAVLEPGNVGTKPARATADQQRVSVTADKRFALLSQHIYSNPYFL
jgi:hypothetical protein